MKKINIKAKNDYLLPFNSQQSRKREISGDNGKIMCEAASPFACRMGITK